MSTSDLNDGVTNEQLAKEVTLRSIIESFDLNRVVMDKDAREDPVQHMLTTKTSIQIPMLLKAVIDRLDVLNDKLGAYDEVRKMQLLNTQLIQQSLEEQRQRIDDRAAEVRKMQERALEMAQEAREEKERRAKERNISKRSREFQVEAEKADHAYRMLKKKLDKIITDNGLTYEQVSECCHQGSELWGMCKMFPFHSGLIDTDWVDSLRSRHMDGQDWPIESLNVWVERGWKERFLNSLDDLLKLNGIGQVTMDKIKRLCTAAEATEDNDDRSVLGEGSEAPERNGEYREPAAAESE